jgi:hypothetical protein
MDKIPTKIIRPTDLESIFEGDLAEICPVCIDGFKTCDIVRILPCKYVLCASMCKYVQYRHNLYVLIETYSCRHSSYQCQQLSLHFTIFRSNYKFIIKIESFQPKTLALVKYNLLFYYYFLISSKTIMNESMVEISIKELSIRLM